MAVESVVINLAFLVSAASLFLPVRGTLLTFLSSYSHSVRSVVESSLSEKSRCKNLLTEVVIKDSTLDKEIDEILSAAKNRASKIELSTKAEIDEMLSKRLELMQNRLTRYNGLVVEDMRQSCAFIAANAVKEFAKNLDQQDQEDILSSCYQDLKENLQ